MGPKDPKERAQRKAAGVRNPPFYHDVAGGPSAVSGWQLAVCWAWAFNKGARRALSEKSAILDPFPSMAKVTAGTTVFPYTGLPRFFISPKPQIMC